MRVCQYLVRQTRLNHFEVEWVFDGLILGIMSDRRGEMEAASSFELGAPGTNYTVRSPGSGPAAPFNARGLEGNNGTPEATCSENKPSGGKATPVNSRDMKIAGTV